MMSISECEDRERTRRPRAAGLTLLWRARGTWTRPRAVAWRSPQELDQRARRRWCPCRTRAAHSARCQVGSGSLIFDFFGERREAAVARRDPEARLELNGDHEYD